MISDEFMAGLILGASIGGLLGSWTDPALGMLLGGDIGAAFMLIAGVLSRPYPFWKSSTQLEDWGRSQPSP